MTTAFVSLKNQAIIKGKILDFVEKKKAESHQESSAFEDKNINANRIPLEDLAFVE